ncbi:MAG: ThiF family adenylyltransferase [Pseudomonadales bacterium]|nr:ThiF family adenylyltransferase [Pseudomonadales bacterium]
MNYDDIIIYLVDSGFDAQAGQLDNDRTVDVTLEVGGEGYTLRHICESELSSLPNFWLIGGSSKEGLAHVLPYEAGRVGSICVTTSDAVSINIEVPELAFVDSLNRHIEILTKAVTDPEWNRSELIREFSANWSMLCSSDELDFLCITTCPEVALLKILSPFPGATSGLRGSSVGLVDQETIDKGSLLYKNLVADKRKNIGVGLIVPLDELPVPPTQSSDVKEWCRKVLQSFSEDKLSGIRDLLDGARGKSFTLIFNGPTSSGVTWFGLKLTTNAKKFLPLNGEALNSWNVVPIRIRTFNPESMLPRGGAYTSLTDKRVLVVGCGSVGGDIAQQLASSGVGEIYLSDFDILSWDNLYRHVLGSHHVGHLKSSSLASDLENKYFWVKSRWYKNRLLDFRDPSLLSSFDLVVVAIGSPTQERMFAHFYEQNNSLAYPPVINTWVEGHGVGGHATLSIPRSKGCLLCSYVDNNDFSRGLASNLNFIEQNQQVTVNIAGCGDLFLPYGRHDSSQTAIMAAGLATKYLRGKVSESTMISWKGPSYDAVDAGIALTHRYHNFTDSLVEKPLHHEGCNACA